MNMPTGIFRFPLLFVVVATLFHFPCPELFAQQSKDKVSPFVLREDYQSEVVERREQLLGTDWVEMEYRLKHREETRVDQQAPGAGLSQMKTSVEFVSKPYEQLTLTQEIALAKTYTLDDDEILPMEEGDRGQAIRQSQRSVLDWKVARPVRIKSYLDISRDSQEGLDGEAESRTYATAFDLYLTRQTTLTPDMRYMERDGFFDDQTTQTETGLMLQQQFGVLPLRWEIRPAQIQSRYVTSHTDSREGYALDSRLGWNISQEMNLALGTRWVRMDALTRQEEELERKLFSEVTLKGDETWLFRFRGEAKERQRVANEPGKRSDENTQMTFSMGPEMKISQNLSAKAEYSLKQEDGIQKDARREQALNIALRAKF